MPVKRQNTVELLATAVQRSQTAIVDVRVERVLKLISEQSLATAAAEQCDTSGTLTIESVDLPHVWEDERVRARVAELEQEGIRVEARQTEKSVAGLTFDRWVLCVQYGEPNTIG